MDDSALKKVVLRPRETDRIRAGHPWVYYGEIGAEDEGINDGDCVQICDHRNHVFGCGFYNSKSKIRVRVLSQKKNLVPNKDFFVKRIRAALELRRRVLPTASSFRVVNAESDFLSGLIIDKYEDILILQTTSLGMDQRKGLIVEALREIFNPVAILEKNDSPSRTFEGMREEHSTLFGTAPEGAIIAKLNGLEFPIDFNSGHKTGCYLDQQMNYQKVANRAKGARVLDCFCFLGGFAIHAAHCGAKEVTGIDQSETAVAAATANAQKNGLNNCSFINANVFDWLIEQTKREAHDEKDLYDLIILDPPSFTRNRHSVEAAMRGYKEIHLRALKLLRTGGTLATFCCSHHVDTESFQDVILAASVDAHKVLRRVETYAQSLDHPIIPIIPETEYLKGFAFEVC